jgi:hypothetical protein
MAVHAKYTVRRPSIAKVFNLSLAVPTAEARCAEGLVSGQDSEVLNLIVAGATAVGAVVAYERAITEQEEIRVRVEQRVAGVTAETVKMPSITG